MNIVRFQINVPSEVALESPQGVVVEGRYGDRMMFHLTDGRVMYVPRIVATRIEGEGIAPGERFELCRTNVKNGRRGSIEWMLKRVDRETSPEPEQPESPLERDLRRSLDAVNGKKPTEDLAPQPADTLAPHPLASSPAPSDLEHDPRHSSDAVNGNGKKPTQDLPPNPPNEPTAPPPATPQPLHAPQTPTAAETAAPPAPTADPNGNGSTPAAHPNGNAAVAVQNGKTESVPVTKLEHALKTAISAAYNAEKYGAELGYVVRFDADAIKSMAITVLINMSQAVRR